MKKTWCSSRLSRLGISFGFIVFLFCAPQIGFASSELVTANSAIEAHVTNMEGLITVWLPGGTVGLSYKEQSFLNVKIGTDIWSNNAYGVGQSKTHALPNATSNGKSGDTIITTWTNVDGLTLVQKVWPVLFGNGGQIVMDFSVLNPVGGIQQTVQAQYCLDLDADGNDAAEVLTPTGYNANWTHFPFDNPIPWFYANFENNLPNAPSYNPGVAGVAIIDDTPLGNVMGLIVPGDKVIVGDWTILTAVSWWDQTTAPSGQYGDGAVLYEWSPIGVLPGKSAELGRTAYGTGMFDMCAGKLLTLTFFPDPLKLVPTPTPHYLPNPFPVQALVVNPSAVEEATGVEVTLSVGPHLTIDTPLTNINAAHTVDTQSLSTNLSPYGVTSLDWLVNADIYNHCAADSVTTFQLSAISTTPVGVIFMSPCIQTLKLPGILSDTWPPVVEKIDSFSSNTGRRFDSLSVGFSDSRCSDLGIQSVTYTYTGPDSTKFLVRFNQAIVPCDRTDTLSVSVEQLDSTVGGCFTFTITDCAGNVSQTSLCFAAHTGQAGVVGTHEANAQANFSAVTDMEAGTVKLSFAPSVTSREIKIFDILGAEVITVQVQPSAASLLIPSTLLRSGTYFAELAGSKARFVVTH